MVAAKRSRVAARAAPALAKNPARERPRAKWAAARPAPRPPTLRIPGTTRGKPRSSIPRGGHVGVRGRSTGSSRGWLPTDTVALILEAERPPAAVLALLLGARQGACDDELLRSVRPPLAPKRSATPAVASEGAHPTNRKEPGARCVEGSDPCGVEREAEDVGWHVKLLKACQLEGDAGRRARRRQIEAEEVARAVFEEVETADDVAVVGVDVSAGGCPTSPGSERRP